jgi:exodeoxyribonuclease VII small subunit
MAAAKKNQQTPPKSFEEALAELEQILSDIEGGQVPLEQSLSMYERGQFLIGHCRGVLRRAEKQIELLGKGDSEAAPVVPDDKALASDSDNDNDEDAGNEP